MKVFLSHSSMNKSNVKAIIKYMPKQILTWLDETNLIWGSKLDETFESVIKTEIDYVIVFISGSRKDNVWVLKELTWAIEKECELGRCIVLPVIMPNVNSDPYIEYPELANKKFITLDNYEETGFKSCAEKITTQLLALIINDLDNVHKPKKENVSKTVTQANSFIEDLCNAIYKIVFKHREGNPISVEELFTQVNDVLTNKLSKEEFGPLLNQVCGILGGIYYDGFELYLTEEHALWKKNIEPKNKFAIAHAASRHIKSGANIYIDAGSTMTKLVEIICKRIESKTLNNLKITVASTEHAGKLCDACAALGYDQFSSPISLYIPGGRVRPNTKAIVGIDSEDEIKRITDSIGKFDIAFIGANGAKEGEGIFTHANEEAVTKCAAKNCAKLVYYCFDDSKCGIVLGGKLADFGEENVKCIINENKENEEDLAIANNHEEIIEVVKPGK